jgi:exodeoxyribonuclease VII large subunit
VTARGQRLRDLARALPRPDTLLEGPRQMLDARADRLPAALKASVQARRVQLSEVSGALRPGLLRRATAAEAQRLANTAARLNLRTLQRDIARKRQDLDSLTRRLSDAGRRQVTTWRDRLEANERLRLTMGYEATLKRGFAVVRGEGRVVTTRVAAADARALEIQFADGRLDVTRTGGRPAKPAKPKDSPDQGSLF